MDEEGSPEYPDQESRLKAELDEARLRYKRSKKELDAAKQIARDLGLNTPDGSHAVRKASLDFGQALDRYGDALKRFSQFVMYGSADEH